MLSNVRGLRAIERSAFNHRILDLPVVVTDVDNFEKVLRFEVNYLGYLSFSKLPD